MTDETKTDTIPDAASAVRKPRRTRMKPAALPDGFLGQDESMHETPAMAPTPAPERADHAQPDAAASPGAAPRIKTHRAEVAHATHGRVRLKVPGAKGNMILLTQMRAAFEGLPGIDLVNVKPDSGSLVIHYDAEHYVNIGALFSHLNTTSAPAHLPAEEHSPGGVHHHPTTELDEKISKLEEEAEFLADHSKIARTLVDSIKQLDRELKRATGNNVDLKILAPVGLAGFTFLEIGAAAATPMWVTLVIFSLNHFVELRAHAPASDATPAAKAKPVPAAASPTRG